LLRDDELDDDGYVSSSSSSCSDHNGRSYGARHGETMKRPPFQFNAQQGPQLGLVWDGTFHNVSSSKLHGAQPIHIPSTVTNSDQGGDHDQPKAAETWRRDNCRLHHLVPTTPSNHDHRFRSANDGDLDHHDSPYHSASDFEPDLDWDPDDNSVSSADHAATATDDLNDSCDFSILSTSTKSMPLSWRDMLSSSSLPSPQSPTRRSFAPRRRSNEAIVNHDKDVASGDVRYYHRRCHTTSNTNPSRSILEWRRTTPTPPRYAPLESTSPTAVAKPAAMTKSQSLPSLRLLLDFEGLSENSWDHGQDTNERVISRPRATKPSMSYSRRRSTSTTPRKVYLLHNT
jgi:hypothetical protein